MMSDEYEQLEQDAKEHVRGKSVYWEGDDITKFYDVLQDETRATYRQLLQDYSGARAMLIDEQEYREARQVPTSLLALLHYYVEQNNRVASLGFHVANKKHAVRYSAKSGDTAHVHYVLFDVIDGNFSANGGYFINSVDGEAKMLQQAQELGFDVEHGWSVVVL